MRFSNITASFLVLVLGTLHGCKGKSESNELPTSEAVEASDAAPARADTPVSTDDKAPGAKEAPPPVTKQIAAPFLWKVAGAAGPTYILGTIHVGVDAEKELPPVVWDAFHTSKTLITEADLSKVDGAKMMQASRLPEGQKLSASLTAKQFKLLETMAGMTGEQIDPFQPWFASILMLQKALLSVPMTGMDMTLVRIAAEKKKTLEYLEDANSQILMLQKAIDAKALAKSLDMMEQQGINTPEAMVKLLGELIDAYRTGDASFDFTKIGGYSDEEMLELMLYKRNREWVPKLLETIKQGNAFVAVGAMHTLGKKSILALLAEKGIKAERVK